MTATQGPSSIPGDVFLIWGGGGETKTGEAKYICIHAHANHAASASVYAVLIQAH